MAALNSLAAAAGGKALVPAASAAQRLQCWHTHMTIRANTAAMANVELFVPSLTATAVAKPVTKAECALGMPPEPIRRSHL